jgi:hemoglobin
VTAGESDDTGETEVVPRPPMTVYRVVGGMAFFDELVERFYKGVATDLLLRPLYPDDLGESKRHLALFLAQYWGGPTAYDDLRGHPRLRMRHAPFIISEPERDAWLRHMAAALDSLVDDHDVHPAVEARLLDYFTSTADAMVNARTPSP